MAASVCKGLNTVYFTAFPLNYGCWTVLMGNPYQLLAWLLCSLWYVMSGYNTGIMVLFIYLCNTGHPSW